MAENIHRGHGFIEVTPEGGQPEYYFEALPRDRPTATMSVEQVEAEAWRQKAIAEAFNSRSIEAGDPHSSDWFIQKIENERVRQRALELLLQQQVPGMILESIAS